MRHEIYWLAHLTARIGELAGALAGSREDTPDWKLNQIITIALDWLEYRADLRNNDPAYGPFTEPRGPGGDG